MKKENTVCIYVDVRGQPVGKDWQTSQTDTSFMFKWQISANGNKRVGLYSLDELLLLFGTSLLFHVQF